MHLVDATMFFCAHGGGVKRYLTAKQAWLRRFRTIRHTLLVPTLEANTEGVMTCASVALPLPGGYRFPLDVFAWRRALVALRPDLIEAGDPYITGIASRQAGDRLGIPKIAFFHSDVPRMLEQRFGAWMKPPTRKYLRAFYRGFDLVLAPSETMLSELNDWGVSCAALQPMGVDADVFHPSLRNTNLRTRHGLRSDARLLIYAGRFAREKNLDVLCAAVRKLGDPYHLLLVGGESAKNIESNITVLPYESDQHQLATLLASADAFVHAGDQETFGLVTVEAMACGLPAVVVAKGALRELVDDRVGVTVPNASIGELAGGIEALFSADWRALGRNARQKVITRYSWDASFTQLTRHYARLIGRPIPVTGALLHADG